MGFAGLTLSKIGELEGFNGTKVADGRSNKLGWDDVILIASLAERFEKHGCVNVL